MSEQILTNAKLILADEVVDGTLVVEGTTIKSIDQSSSSLPVAIDCAGDYLLPGLVELHTDNMEKYFSPRPGVVWPKIPAIMTHDTQMAGAGITTVFDAVSVGYENYKSTRAEILEDVIESINYITDHQLAKADHFLHLRCELSCDTTSDEFDQHANNSLLKLVSLMDHAPGQRQFARIDKYIEYYQNKYGFSDEQMQKNMDEHRNASATWAGGHRQHIAEYCQTHAIPMASHDDATSEHVEEAIGFGVNIAEFPTTLEAARLSHQNQLNVLMGAPNMMRGFSHSGNVSSRDLANEGVLDILSSDYYPSSLLHSAFMLADLGIGYDLPAAVQCVSTNPAQAASLDDRGQLNAGLLADILRVGQHEDMPVIKSVWKNGMRVS